MCVGLLKLDDTDVDAVLVDDADFIECADNYLSDSSNSTGWMDVLPGPQAGTQAQGVDPS